METLTILPLNQPYPFVANLCRTGVPTLKRLISLSRSTEEADRLLLAAAEGGFAPAQFDLGLSRSRAGNLDWNQWLRLAAEGGHPEALLQLGSDYYNGTGVLQDKREAARLWELAAERWHTVAIMWLGNMYTDGDGVLQDFVRGHAWYNIASALGSETGASRRDSLAQRMTVEQIAEAQRLAGEWVAAH